MRYLSQRTFYFVKEVIYSTIVFTVYLTPSTGELIEEDFIEGMRRCFTQTNEEFYLGDMVDEDVNQNWVN